jgi:hypothetical protein
MDHYLAQVATLDAKTASLTSPYCAEGHAKIFESLLLNTGTQPCRGSSDRWFANIPLAETGSIEVVASFFNSEVNHTNQIAWTPFNVLVESNMAIRAGDALRLTARPDEGMNGVVLLDIAGVTNYTVSATEPVKHRFMQAGSYTVTGLFSNDTETIQRSVVVNVISASLPDEKPAVWQGWKRTWVCPGLPSNQGVVEGDGSFSVARASADGSVLELLAREIEGSHAVVVRVSPGGPILDSRPIDGFWADANVQGYFPVVEKAKDGSRIVRNTLIARKLPPTVVLTLRAWVGGVTFDDGHTTKMIKVDDLEANGELPYYLVISPSGYAACHAIVGTQAGVTIGSR